MKRKTIIALLLALVAVLLFNGCLTVEYKEYYFKIESDGSGSGYIKFINIISQEDEEKDVSFDDFGTLVSDYVEGTTFEDENPGLTVTEKKLYEEKGILCGEVKFTFKSINKVNFYRDESCECSSYLYYTGSLSETVDKTNGEFLGDEDEFPFIRWSPKTTEFKFTTKVVEDLEGTHSLLELYEIWKKKSK